MKIDPRQSLPEISTGAANDRASSARLIRMEKNATSPDEVRLSADRHSLQTLQAGSKSAPDIRWERVNALQKAIQDGSYNVSNGQVADAMFSELFSPGSH